MCGFNGEAVKFWVSLNGCFLVVGFEQGFGVTGKNQASGLWPMAGFNGELYLMLDSLRNSDAGALFSELLLEFFLLPRFENMRRPFLVVWISFVC